MFTFRGAMHAVAANCAQNVACDVKKRKKKKKKNTLPTQLHVEGRLTSVWRPESPPFRDEIMVLEKRGSRRDRGPLYARRVTGPR